MPRRTIRVGVTGLARAGKTAFLTSVAANLLALGTGRAVLPGLTTRLGGRQIGVTLAPSGASPLPRFDHAAHLAALAAEPPAWPARTDSVSMLALDLALPRTGFATALPPQRVRLELLDYPGEWLLDLPLLRLSFEQWSELALRRLEGRPEASGFLGFVAGLPATTGADEALAGSGHQLYVETLRRLRDAGTSLLQPGRFLMPAPGPIPGWMPFFPHRGTGGLHGLLARRYQAYVQAVSRDLSDPLFGQIDRLLVLVDLLSALSLGQAAFEDARRAVAEAAGALRWRQSWLDTALGTAAALGRLRLPPPVVSRVVFAATKADHVGERQRGNLVSLLRQTVEAAAPVRAAYFALASVLCTTDDVMMLDGRPVSAVRGHRPGEKVAIKSYPGEVPPGAPDEGFWAHKFYGLPDFQPKRLPNGGRNGVENLGLDAVLVSLLDDLL